MRSVVHKSWMLAQSCCCFASLVASAAEPTIKVMVRDTHAAQRTAAKLDPVKNPYTDYIFAKTGVRVVLDWQAGESAPYNEKVPSRWPPATRRTWSPWAATTNSGMNTVRAGALEPLNAQLAKYRTWPGLQRRLLEGIRGRRPALVIKSGNPSRWQPGAS